MQSKNLILVTALLLGVMGLSADAGKLTFVSGQVEIDTGKGWQKAQLGTIVNEADKIKTGAKGIEVSIKEDKKFPTNRAKLVCTLGPACDTEGGLGQLIEIGRAHV